METLTQFGSYQIIRKIGAGGMADVYEAVRVGLEDFQTRVALKCILPAMTRDERFVKMFINEARLGSQLQHPNIIQIQDFNKVNDTYYIAMEYVEGVDLSRIIKRMATRGLSLPATVVIDLAIQALAGLGYAHDARRMDGSPMNIIHRDVKPSNFLITPSGAVKVGDFGIAKMANSANNNSLTGDSLKGTINYMSPEQIDGTVLTPSSDLFSVAAIVFEMLTLRSLFDGPTMSATLIKIAMVNIEQDMQVVASRYREFEPLLRKALARDPKDRFQVATAMASDLHKLKDEIGDGLSLREFLAMHKELFEPYGTQPGEQEEDEGPLSMAMTPPLGSDRPDIFSTNPNLHGADLAQSFELDGEEEVAGEVRRELLDQEMAFDDEANGGPVNFEYYPPARSESAFAPSSPSPSMWGEDLGSAAQRLLADEESEATTYQTISDDTAKTAMAEAVVEEESHAPAPGRTGFWIAVVVASIALGVLASFLVGPTRPPPVEPPVVAATVVQPPAPEPEVTVAPAGQPLPRELPVEPAQLVLSSDPSGAHIVIDDKRIDALTPTTLPLPADKSNVTVRLELDGYRPFSQDLTYRPGQQIPLSPSLVPAELKGTILVDSEPRGARIFLDMHPTGLETPARLTDVEGAGEHHIVLRLNGYQVWMKDVTLGSDGNVNVSANLERIAARDPVPRPPAPRVEPPPQPRVVEPAPAPVPASAGVATLALNTIPPDAEVYIDNRKRGEVPLVLPVTSGQHVIEFRTVSGKRKSTPVTLKENEQRRVVWDSEEDKWISR